MDYVKLIGMVPAGKRKAISDKLIDIILASKNEDKMPSDLANTILYQWQQNLLTSKLGLSTLLKAAVLLEQEKTLAILKELQLNKIQMKLKEKSENG